MQLPQIQKRLPLFIAICCGIMAIVLLNVYLQRRETQILEKVSQIQEKIKREARPPAPVEPPTPKMGIALLAKNNISAQAPITPSDIEIKELPVNAIQPGVATSLDQVIGQIAAEPIAKGEQIVKAKLLPAVQTKSLSDVTPEGKRAVAILVDNASNITSLIKPGDFVDVFASLSPPSSSGKAKPTVDSSRIVLISQNVKVLAVGTEVIDSQILRKEQATRGGASGSVTLALTPQEAILLSFVQEHGKIKLVMRSFEDMGTESIKPVDWDSLLQYLYPPIATKEGSPSLGNLPTVEIYRGVRKEVIPLSDGEK